MHVVCVCVRVCECECVVMFEGVSVSVRVCASRLHTRLRGGSGFVCVRACFFAMFGVLVCLFV